MPETSLSSRPSLSLHAAHDVHLPELHGLQAFPAAVVLALATALLGIDQAMAHQAAIDRGARGLALELLPRQVVGDRARAPARVGEAHLDDARLDRRRRAVRAACWSRRGVGQAADAAARVASQPAVQRLAADPVAPRHRDHAVAREDLEHCLVALFHDPQLDEHDLSLPVERPLPVVSSRRVAPVRWRDCRTATEATVAQEPKPLSPGD